MGQATNTDSFRDPKLTCMTACAARQAILCTGRKLHTLGGSNKSMQTVAERQKKITMDALFSILHKQICVRLSLDVSLMKK